jgi:hypothetical protein
MTCFTERGEIRRIGPTIIFFKIRDPLRKYGTTIS